MDVRKKVLSSYSIDEDRLTAINILVNHWHNRRKNLRKELKDQEALNAGKLEQYVRSYFPLTSLL